MSTRVVGGEAFSVCGATVMGRLLPFFYWVDSWGPTVERGEDDFIT